jgi:6-phosphogluconate dehydrogenase (decarboxylating)
MPSGALPDADPAVHSADRRRAGAWLVQHGLGDGRPTPLLTTRLAARRRARRADHFMLAALKARTPPSLTVARRAMSAQ